MTLVAKNLPAIAGDRRDIGSIPGLGRFPGGGHGNPPLYFCLENPMDRGAWWDTVSRFAKSQTQLKWLSMHAHLNKNGAFGRNCQSLSWCQGAKLGKQGCQSECTCIAWILLEWLNLNQVVKLAHWMLVRLYSIAGVLERTLPVLHPDLPSLACSMCQPLASLCCATPCLSLGPPPETASGLFAKTVKHVLMTPMWGYETPILLPWGRTNAEQHLCSKCLTGSGRNWGFVWSLLEFGFFCCLPLLPFFPNCFLQGVVAVQSLSQVWLCYAMDCSTQGFPVLHYFLEFAQIHVHWASDAIQPSHPLSSPAPPAFNLSQHQGLFQWVCSLHQMAKVSELQLQHKYFQWIFRVDFL